MNKKTWIIIWIVLLIAGGIWAFLYFNKSNTNNVNNKTNSIKINPNALSYNYNYTYSGTIKENNSKEIIFNWNVNAWIYSEDRWLKQRLVLNKFDWYAKKWKRTLNINLNWWDIIQNEYKKYVKIWNINVIKNNKAIFSNKDIKDFKQGKYYLFDDSFIKEKLGDIYNYQLVKTFVRSYLTSNQFYYLRKYKFFESFKKTILSEKLAHKIFKKENNKVILSDIICNLYISNYEKRNCKRNVEGINNAFDINWEKNNDINSVIIKWKEGELKWFIGKINYKNGTFENIEINYDGSFKFNNIIDLKWIKKISFNLNNDSGKTSIDYERWVKKLFADINLSSDKIKIKWKIKDWKWKISIINWKNRWILKIDEEKLEYLFASKKIKWKIKINFENDILNVLIKEKEDIISINYENKKITSNWNLSGKKWKINLDLSTYE